MTMQPNDQNQVDDSNKHQIRISDLPGEIRTAANLIGLKPVLQLANEYNGMSIYILNLMPLPERSGTGSSKQNLLETTIRSLQRNTS
jgi:hypothetical protein